MHKESELILDFFIFMRDFPIWTHALDSKNGKLIRKYMIENGDPYSIPYYIFDMFDTDSNAANEVDFDAYYDIYLGIWEKLANVDSA